jgi:hypothetical protein
MAADKMRVVPNDLLTFSPMRWLERQYRGVGCGTRYAAGGTGDLTPSSTYPITPETLLLNCRLNREERDISKKTAYFAIIRDET